MKIIIVYLAIVVGLLLALLELKEQNIQDLIKLKDAYAGAAASSRQYYSAFCIEDKNGVIACMYSKDKADYDRLQKGEQPVHLQEEI